MADRLPVTEWVAIRQSPERDFTWTARGALIAPDLGAALCAARLMGADDVLLAEHVDSFGGWATGARERARDHVRQLRMDRMSGEDRLAPCGAQWHGERAGNPDDGCGWGDLCDGSADRYIADANRG